MAVSEALVNRANYATVLQIPTRWSDNDIYGHVNNAQYYAFFDTVINHWLINEGGLDIQGGETIGLCAESHCQFLAALAFPGVVDAALRVGHLGRTSVRYELALFGPDPGPGPPGPERPAATGWFVHVFVDRAFRRPAEIPSRLRDCLERLKVAAEVTL